MAAKFGMKMRRPRGRDHKDAILCATIENRLKKHFSGELELSSTQLKAAELLYARLRPTLSAVEQHMMDDRDRLTNQELVLRAQAILSEQPAIIAQLIRLLSPAAQAEIRQILFSPTEGAVAPQPNEPELASCNAPNPENPSKSESIH